MDERSHELPGFLDVPAYLLAVGDKPMNKWLQDPGPPGDHPCARDRISGVVDRDSKPLGISAQILAYKHPGGNLRNDLRYAMEENNFLPFYREISQVGVESPCVIFLTCAVSQYFFQSYCHFIGHWLNKAIFGVRQSIS